MESFKLAMACMVSWGVGSFVAKVATNRIGEKAVVWDVFGYAVAMLIYFAIVYKPGDIVNGDKAGNLLALLAGAIGSGGAIFFYLLLTKRDASSAVPLTALYPVLTAILAFLFLGEKLTIAKGAGIILSGLALYLLSI